MPLHPAVGNPSPPCSSEDVCVGGRNSAVGFPVHSLQKVSPGVLSDTSLVHVIRQDPEKDVQILLSVLSWLLIAFPHSC